MLQSRLTSLIEYAQQSALLRLSPQTEVSRHGRFTKLEDSIRDLPGIHLNPQIEEDSDEIWLIVDRLQESPAPLPESIALKTWVEISNNPTKEPSFHSHVEAERLIAIGAMAVPEEVVAFDIKQLIAFASFPEKENIEDQLKAYLKNKWQPWAAQEKRRRKTISLYAELFTLKQQLEGGIVDAQLELVWGIGMAVWNMDKVPVTYPIITKLVELSLNEKTMAIEIRPRELDPRMELEIYSVVDNAGVPNLDKIAKDFFSKATNTISPFDRASFEPILRSVVVNLHPKGVYWPSQVPADDRTLPKATEELRVTDTWVIFARPKSASVFIQDLENFKKQIDGNENTELSLPETVRALITEPSSSIDEYTLPRFRGVSMIGTAGDGNSKAARDLFFPMAFNDEQVQIVQLLECFDGVVVQGPPGTGKTHTIANVICHYLAEGKKVLVTSMKDPALTVLKEKLPAEIQPLAISVLTSESDGLKQFEHAISKIADEVQRINRQAYSQEISRLEGAVNSYHALLSKIDAQVNEWAKKNLQRIKLDDEIIEPKDAAEEVTTVPLEIQWLDDAINIGAEYKLQIDESDISALRDARRNVGADIAYLSCSLPQMLSFPDSQHLIQVHQDLARSTELKAKVDSGLVVPLISNAKATLETAQTLSAQISNLNLLRQTIENANTDWAKPLQELLRAATKTEVFSLFEALSGEINTISNERTVFLAKPVFVPDNCEQNDVVTTGIDNLAQGKPRPFGISGLVGKGAEKKILESIRIVSTAPISPADWQHVHNYLSHVKSIKALLMRWKPLANELNLLGTSLEPGSLSEAVNFLSLYSKIKEVIALEDEVINKCKETIPAWPKADDIRYGAAALNEASSIILHHLTQNHLTEVWATKERFQIILAGCNGLISSSIKDFLDHALGNPAFDSSIVQTQWSNLMEELRRVHSFAGAFDTIRRIAGQIKKSGAPQWAQRLSSEPMVSAVDDILPSNWRECWRLKRLQTYLSSIDARRELKRLGCLRSEAEHDLAKTYQEIVSKRTWLKLAENANPTVRAALKAYMAAIARIGKGTGKRAVRYRQDAKQAAVLANPAIPCWIMRHDRVSETLPPQFGCFDLVIIDEASQSDLTALPAILRAKKILVVGDDKQVSPEGVGIEEDKIRSLMSRFLANQVDLYRAQMSPDRSIYDLFKVVFAGSSVMLREHFRCVAPIIEYSKREFYNHELKPLRLPRSSERLDPPLVDIFIEDGFRKGDINLGEARFIVDEIKKIVNDEKLANRSIGVVSLLGGKQALKIWEMLEQEIDLELINRHQIACGDAKTFQGKERDIMFMSMVVSLGNAVASSKDTFRQRFNVAASRARDRMYLVRSITSEDLSSADDLRRGLIAHFNTPFAIDEERAADLRKLCESPFEREVYDLLTERGYRTTPQVPVGDFRIDMVVEGHNDARLAIECDGDRYHGIDQWENDMRRQRILERAGWRFWRCFASTFVMNKDEVIADLINNLHSHGIDPMGATEFVVSPHVEQRRISVFYSNERVSDVDAVVTTAAVG
jgi:very-short-patch-repair endonuclease/DNA-directed RNA polymerase subunit L